MATGPADEQKLALRVKSKKSQNTVVRDISTKQTVQAFLEKLSQITDVPEDRIMLLTGFPPKKVDYDRMALVESLGLSNQDTVIVELDPNPNDGAAGYSRVSDQADVPPAKPPVKDEHIIRALSSNPMTMTEPFEMPAYPEYPPPPPVVESELSKALTAAPGSRPSRNLIHNPDEGMLFRQIVPSNNSCLFTSINFCLTGDLNLDQDPGASHMRELIAATVVSDPERFDEAMLGRPNADYVQWILKSESWGGGIELSILTDFYEIEMCVVDIQSLHISKFGEDKNYSQRMLLLYDGIHYDPLYLEPFDESRIRTLFPTSEGNTILDKAVQLGREAKAAHQFTDLSNFSLKCGICYKLLKGQTEAQAHAKKTGHTNFSEIIQ